MDRRMETNKRNVRRRRADKQRDRDRFTGRERKHKETVTLKKEVATAVWCLTLPEGRLQFSRAVSTRFLSAENILKILQGHTNTALLVITHNVTQIETGVFTHILCVKLTNSLQLSIDTYFA